MNEELRRAREARGLGGYKAPIAITRNIKERTRQQATATAKPVDKSVAQITCKLCDFTGDYSFFTYCGNAYNYSGTRRICNACFDERHKRAIPTKCITCKGTTWTRKHDQLANAECRKCKQAAERAARYASALSAYRRLTATWHALTSIPEGNRTRKEQERLNRVLIGMEKFESTYRPIPEHLND